MKKSILLILSVLLIMAIMAGLLAHFVFPGPASSVQNKPIGVNVSVTGSNVPAGIKAVTTSAQPPFTLTPLGPTVDISPGGKIQGGPITLRFKLNKRVSSQQVLLAVRETASSQWTLMKPSAVSADGWYVDVQTDHLCFWQPLFYDLGESFKLLKEYFNGLTGDMFTSAEKPTCLNEAQAREEGYTITSYAKKTLYWCFGVEKGRRVLKLVNRTSYPLEIQHPGLTTIHQDYTLDAGKLARFGSGHNSFLFPFEEVDYTLDLKPGEKALVNTAYSGYAQALYRIEVGITALASILSRFGLSKDNFSVLASKKGMKFVLDTFSHFLDFKNCANALFPVPNGGKLISGCFTPAQVADAFGWMGVILAPLMAVGSIFQYFRSELESAIDIAGDNDKYRILVSRLTPSIVTSSYEVPDGAVLGDITAGPDGNLWFTASRATNSGRIGWIGRITPDGQVTAFSLPSAVANVEPGAIINGPDGNLWFVLLGRDYFPAPSGSVIPGQIGRITTNGIVTVFPAASATSEPAFLATGPDGNVWFTDMNGSIGRITPDGQITEFPVPTGNLRYAGIAVGADENMWFATGGTIGRITLNGKVTLLQETADLCPGVCGFMPGPPTCDLVAGPDGNLWFTDNVNGYIGRITLNGSITGFPANGTPGEITAGPDGNLWFTDSIEGIPPGVVGRITTGGSITFPVPNSHSYDLKGIAVGPDDNLWFTGQTSEGNGIIVRMTL